jgi:hypothetical protein
LSYKLAIKYEQEYLSSVKNDRARINVFSRAENITCEGIINYLSHYLKNNLSMFEKQVNFLNTETLITNKCKKRVLLSIVKHSYMFGLHCSAVQAGTAGSSRLRKQRSTQSVEHSHSIIKCKLGVTITKKFSLKMNKQGRSM